MHKLSLRRRGATILAASALSLGIAATAGPTPAHAAGLQSLTVKVGTSCSGAVLNTQSGTWIISARHCAAARTVAIGRRTYTIRRIVAKPGPQVTNDVMLVQVNGNIKSYAGGGFGLGTAPSWGSHASVYGIGAGPHGALHGCNSLYVSYHLGFPEVHNCYLPTGTSGGPWFTGDRVLRGVVGGLNNGGSSDYITDTIPFTSSVLSWAFSYLY